MNKILQEFVIKTKTDLDDHLLKVVKKPVFVTVVLVGFYFSCFPLALPVGVTTLIERIVKSGIIIFWIFSGMSFGVFFVDWIYSHKKADSVEIRTKPLFTTLIKIGVFLLGGYLVLLTWGKDATALVTSASVVGLVFGFAAKDSIANLFSGVFIMADAPYKIGDYIVLGSGERGRVTDIGLRSTRILTTDDVEIIIPNAVIGSDKIINQSGGPSTKFRVRASTSVAYGSDIDQVRDILMSVGMNEELALKDPRPVVHFTAFGDSGLNFDLLCWVDPPRLRGKLLDRLNCSIYKALNEAGIEIPYPKLDVSIQSIPGREEGGVVDKNPDEDRNSPT
jgi:small-conductance mechanosensitive channel